MESNVTIVTGIWDIGRSELGKDWSRPFSHYLDHLENILKIPNNLIIFIPKQYRSFVESKRDLNKTLIVERNLDWFKTNKEIYDAIQKIRTDARWYSQAEWLTNSTQAKLELYNPIVMSKMFLLHDAKVLDPFNSTHLIWVDGALSHTVNGGYFWHDNVFNKIDKYFNKFSFVCFPYNGKKEIHGFEYESICQYAKANVSKVARGGIFGGPKNTISKTNSLYYSLLYDTLSNQFMGTEESIFTILVYLYPDLFNCYDIKEDGLLWPFFEELKNETLKKSNENQTSLYVISYNSPDQFEGLCKSFIQYDNDFQYKPIKILINNSSDTTTDEKYNSLCATYGFEQIKKDNIGICGGRQFIAEHFEQSNSEYYFFFEDDMFFYLKDGNFCKNGFTRKIDNLYERCLVIMKQNNFDFLKLNFTEFFGDNSDQWAWHNVPKEIREKMWNENKSIPKTKFNNIKSYEGVPYSDGEIYYSNWPQVVSREGNKKMFLDTKWAYPREQTWMSHIFQLTIQNKIKPGILLATPTEHDRFDHYQGERKES